MRIAVAYDTTNFWQGLSEDPECTGKGPTLPVGFDLVQKDESAKFYALRGRQSVQSRGNNRLRHWNRKRCHTGQGVFLKWALDEQADAQARGRKTMRIMVPGHKCLRGSGVDSFNGRMTVVEHFASRSVSIPSISPSLAE